MADTLQSSDINWDFTRNSHIQNNDSKMSLSFINNETDDTSEKEKACNILLSLKRKESSDENNQLRKKSKIYNEEPSKEDSSFILDEKITISGKIKLINNIANNSDQKHPGFIKILNNFLLELQPNYNHQFSIHTLNWLIKSKNLDPKLKARYTQQYYERLQHPTMYGAGIIDLCKLYKYSASSKLRCKILDLIINNIKNINYDACDIKYIKNDFTRIKNQKTSYQITDIKLIEKFEKNFSYIANLLNNISTS